MKVFITLFCLLPLLATAANRSATRAERKVFCSALTANFEALGFDLGIEPASCERTRMIVGNGRAGRVHMLATVKLVSHSGATIWQACEMSFNGAVGMTTLRNVTTSNFCGIE